MVTFRPSFQKSQQAAGGVQTWAKQRVEGVGGRKPDFACVAHVSEGRAGHHGTQACKPCPACARGGPRGLGRPSVLRSLHIPPEGHPY